MNECPKTFTFYSVGRLACQRPADHPGGCHNVDPDGDGYYWLPGMGSGLRAGSVECVTCGMRHNGEDRACVHCKSWEERLDNYIAGRTVVAGGTLYSWEPRNTGAFGNRKVIVRMKDGRVFGPASCLWHVADVPTELLDVFEDSADLEWVR